MKRSKFSEEQVAYALRQAEAGTLEDATLLSVLNLSSFLGETSPLYVPTVSPRRSHRARYAPRLRIARAHRDACRGIA